MGITIKSRRPELIVAFSGGKDSTAMALRLMEMGERFRLLHTATGNELPEVKEHIQRVLDHTGAEMIDLDAPTLDDTIKSEGCLPNWRMRFCTRMIKIEPCVRWLNTHPNTVLAVGLRHDEEGRAGGIYKCAIRYPLREWKWGLDQVVQYLELHDMYPPDRTDCALCFFQTLHEWWELWKNHPEEYAKGEKWEATIGHTFRSPGRDIRPAALKDLRTLFKAGFQPKERTRKVMCRICSM